MTTVKDLAFFLIYKKEHYPLSDEFITHYQQSQNGYIDFAIKTGHLVDPKRCEPNQKWHFFESWLIRSFEDGTITSWDDDAYKTVYNRIKCPELWLWLLEAVGLDSSHVEAAKKIAEEGKKRNSNSETITKEIRKRIPWEVIESAIR